MKRFILPLGLVGIMVVAVAGIGFFIVKLALDSANQPAAFSYRDLEDMQERGKVEDKDVPRLLICFERNDEDLRIKAAETLAKVGAPAVPPLKEKLKSSNVKVRYYALQTLAFMDPKDAEGAAADVAGCLDHADADVRRKAVYVIGRIGKNEAAFEGLVKALGDADPGVAETALEVLGKVETPPAGALPAIAKLAQDANPQKRAEALKLLTKMGEPAVPAFRELLQKTQGIEKIQVIEAIVPLGAHARPILPELEANLTANVWWDNEEQILGIFKKCGPEGAKGLTNVLKAIQDPKSPHFANSIPRSATLLKALGEMGPQAKDATPMLVDLLKEKVALRPQVLETLGDIGPAAKAAIPAIEPLTTDPAVGAAARAALKRMGAS